MTIDEVISEAKELHAKATKDWHLNLGGGHAYPSIESSESVHTNGKARNALGISSASYSTQICELHCDPSLLAPAANIEFILKSRTLLPLFARLLEIYERHRGEYDFELQAELDAVLEDAK